MKTDYIKIKRLFSRLWPLKLVRLFFLVVVLVICIPVIAFFFMRPHPHEEINYGVTFSDKYATELKLDWKGTYLMLLKDLEVKNLRLVVYWEDVEPVNDIYDYSRIKWMIEEADVYGADVTVVMGRKVPRWPECFEPGWWHNLESEEQKRIELMQFIEQTTIELKDYDNVVMWQVENEPFFPFGECDYPFDKKQIKEEIATVQAADDRNRPIMVQDSGEGGFWYPTYDMADYLGISMYRRIWFDFWGVFLGRSVYFQYPLSHWTYYVKAKLIGVPPEKIIVTELQAEPWGPRINSELTTDQKNQTMSKTHFLSTLSYARKSGFKDLYLWGAEWWLWEKDVNDNPFYWDTAKALFR